MIVLQQCWLSLREHVGILTLTIPILVTIAAAACVEFMQGALNAFLSNCGSSCVFFFFFMKRAPGDMIPVAVCFI